MSRILATVLLHQVLGLLWYSPSTFGPRWLEAQGKALDTSTSIQPTALLVSVVVSVAYALFLRKLIAKENDWRVGAGIGTYVGVVFGMGTLALHYSFLGLQPELIWIDGGREVVVGFVSGMILTAKKQPLLDKNQR